MTTKMCAERRELIHGLLAGGTIATHDALRRVLSAAGHAVTQATVSRDMKAMGYLRGRDGWIHPRTVARRVVDR